MERSIEFTILLAAAWPLVRVFARKPVRREWREHPHYAIADGIRDDRRSDFRARTRGGLRFRYVTRWPGRARQSSLAPLAAASRLSCLRIGAEHGVARRRPGTCCRRPARVVAALGVTVEVRMSTGANLPRTAYSLRWAAVGCDAARVANRSTGVSRTRRPSPALIRALPRPARKVSEPGPTRQGRGRGRGRGWQSRGPR